MTPDQEAVWRAWHGLDPKSPLQRTVVEANYGMQAGNLPVHESLPDTSREHYNNIMQQMQVVSQRVFQSVLQGNTQAEKGLTELLDELCGEALACFRGGSGIVFGCAQKNTAFWVTGGRRDALKHTCEITEKALPRLDVVGLTTPVDVVEPGSRAKGAATRSAGSTAGGHMGDEEPKWATLPQVPMMVHASGLESFTVRSPDNVAMMRLYQQELLLTAQELDAALEARGEEPEHVNALEIAMQQVAACEEMYRMMQEAGKSWRQEEYFRLVLPPEARIMLDDGALRAFFEGRVDSLVFNLMPPGSDVSSGISYVAVHMGTESAPACFGIPCMDKHLGDLEFPKMVPGPNIHACIFAPPGLVVQGKLGGAFVRAEGDEGDMHRLVNATLGAHLSVLSAVGKSTTMDRVNGRMHATVPVVLKPERSMSETKNDCRKLFSMDIEGLVLTVGSVVCEERYSNVERDEDGMVDNESFTINLRRVQAHARRRTSRLFNDLVPEETRGTNELHSLVVVNSTHNGAPALFAGACGSTFSVERAMSRAALVALPQEDAQCFFKTDAQSNFKTIGILSPGADNSDFCAYEHQTALSKVLLDPQSAYRLPDGTMQHGLEGLRAALGVRTLGELMYLGIFKTVQEDNTITVTKHDGTDDTTGEFVDMSKAQLGTCGSSPCLVLSVPSRLRIKVTLEAGRTPIERFDCTYLTETGEEEPENENIKLKPGEKYELPFPSQFQETGDPDGWRVNFGHNSHFYIFFYVEGSKFERGIWGKKCSLEPPLKRGKT
jgi:hypothetical protein